MASLQTKIQVWNMALDRLREQPLSATTDQTATALWLGRNYDQQRDFLLERYLWKFTMARAEVAADGTAPDWGWDFRYLIPFEQEAGYILCNVAGPLRLRYINRTTNEGLFSNGFCECLSLRLAVQMAHWLTGKASMFDTLANLYANTLTEVKQTEAVQVPSGTYYDTDILEARSAY